MKILFILMSIILLTGNLAAQPDSLKNDTTFYQYINGFLHENKAKDKAEGFEVKSAFNPNKHVVNIYYLQDNKPMAEYECYDKKFVSEKKNVKSIFSVKNGKYFEWYPTGEKRILCYYEEDKLNGEFTVYYKNGNIKRQELWKKGEWQSGKCFDESGNETTYCLYQEGAEFIGGFIELVKFLSNEVKYPKNARKKGITGTVDVNFTVDTDGTLTDIKVIKGVDIDLDNEALRVVAAMPKWKPGKFEGNLVKYQFTLPIKFSISN